MRRLEFQAIFSFPRDERVELSEFLVAVHEGLRGDEAAGERDVHLARIGLAPKLNSDFLRLALTESVFFIHEYRRHAIEKFAVEIGIAREMHPTEFLNGRYERRELERID